jgi:DNA-binding transcriptional LysR family regulator
MSAAPTASSEMAFFNVLARSGSLAAAARELGVTTPAVSKRLAQMEARLGVALMTRTTRRFGLTPEGEIYLTHARRILAEIDDMEQLVTKAVAAPKGLLRVNATLGFGRSHIAPLIAQFSRSHPEVQVQLQLSVNPPPLGEDAFDVCVCFGEPPDARVLPGCWRPTGACCARRPATWSATARRVYPEIWRSTAASPSAKAMKATACGACRSASAQKPSRCKAISPPTTGRSR